ncbi:MAG: hypothetical protein QOE31_3834 [Solirubrobacteraceae bacterium]|nr:hypothetical protein [Solirubrobacteraceae bacterium]
MDVGGRPPGLFGAKHRSHTTAWIVFTDVVRNAVLNQPLPDAIHRMHHLMDEARALPGAHPKRLDALRSAVQVRPADAPDVTGRQIYDEAHDNAAKVVQNSRLALQSPIGSGLLVAVLQDLIGAYLRLRNATPLSVTHNVDIATGAGEGSARGALAGDEAAEEPPADRREGVALELAAVERGEAVPPDPGQARARLWALLDFDAATHLAVTQPSDQPGYSTVPGSGAGESVAGRLASVVTQHLVTVRAAYPRVFAHAHMDEEDSLRPVLGAHADLEGGDGLSVIRSVQARLAGVARPLQPASRENVKTPQGAPRGTTQIRVGMGAGGEPIVGRLQLGSRPHGILGSAEGAHLTAFGLIAQELQQQIVFAPLTQVAARVGNLIAQARALPTAKRSNALQGDAQARLAAADARATATLNAAQSTPHTDPAFVANLQELILAYLWLRNSLPLAATTEVGVPAGHGEGLLLGHLRWAEHDYQAGAGQADDAVVLDTLWGLLDAGALKGIVESVSPFAAPGIRARDLDEMLRRAGDVVATHLMTANAAFPLCVARTQMGSVASLRGFLQARLPRPENRDDEIYRRRQDESLTFADDEANRVVAYITTGTLPAAAPPVVRQSPYSSRTRTPTRPRPGEYDEDDFGEMEQKMLHSSSFV